MEKKLVARGALVVEPRVNLAVGLESRSYSKRGSCIRAGTRAKGKQ